MKVRDAIAILKQIDGDVELIIDHRSVHGIETVKGRLKADYFGNTFTLVPEHKARDIVVRFTYLTEKSDGKTDTVAF